MTKRWTVAAVALAALLYGPVRAQGQAAFDEDAFEAAEDAQEREQDRKEREQQRAEDEAERAADREQEAYERGTDAIDDERWEQAAGAFDRVVAMKGKKSDAALYWKAYAQSRAGRRAEALASIAQLRAAAPKSRWLDDAGALEIEIRGESGQRPGPEASSDEEIKLIAINALLNSDSDEAVPMLEKFLAGNASLKLKKKALFVLSQGDSPRARVVVTEIARGRRNPQLQDEALKYLGLFGGDESRKALADIYASTADVEVKKDVLNSFMLSGDSARVMAAARGEKDPALRAAAVKLMGIMGATAELSEMYRAETAVPVRKSILHAMFLAGATDKLGEVMRTERDASLRADAIHNLGLAGGDGSAQLLESTYASDSDREVRKQIQHALFLQGNATTLVRIARAEKDPELRKSAVHWLSLMGSKEATSFLMEILDK